jgi:hypothetical protein
MRQLSKGLTASFALALTLGILSGCGGGNSPSGSTLRLTNRGLKPLLNGFHYEGWALIDGKAETTGKFNVDAGGNLVDLSGNPIPNGDFSTGLALGRASAVVITIEPAGDTDKVAAKTHIVAGSLSGGSANLTVGDSRALGSDFASAVGNYVIATPTDGDGNNEKSGVWFIRMDDGPKKGLTLPALPEGWKYEGWAVINGTPVSTGTFRDPAMADASAPFSGSQPAPPFPGEDFLQNAPAGLSFPTDVAGGKAVISIEPDADDSPAPFELKPLMADISTSAVAMSNYVMSNNAASFPTMGASVR